MQQQSFRFYDIDPEQLSFDFPVQQRSYVQTDLFTSELVIASSYAGKYEVMNSYLSVNNSDGVESARIDDTGISLRMKNQSWLKTKIANWLGVKYL